MIICRKLTDFISHEKLTVNDVKNILLKKFPVIITRNKGYIDNFYKEGIDGIRLEALKSAQYLIDYHIIIIKTTLKSNFFLSKSLLCIYSTSNTFSQTLT